MQNAREEVGMFCAASPLLPVAHRERTFVKVHFLHFSDPGLETPKPQGRNIN